MNFNGPFRADGFHPHRRYGDFARSDSSGRFFEVLFMRIGVMGIIIEKDRSMAQEVQRILSAHAELIMARTGLPDRENGIYVISLIVRGTNEKISALAGKLGKLPNVKVKSAVTDAEIPADHT